MASTNLLFYTISSSLDRRVREKEDSVLLEDSPRVSSLGSATFIGPMCKTKYAQDSFRNKTL